MIWIAVGVVVLWGVWAFGSEMLLNLRLNAQVDALRAHDAQLAQSNAQTRTELATAASAAAMEESARQQGYYKQGEQVYVIVQPSPSAAAQAAAAPAAQAHTSTGDGVWGTIIRWWRRLWH